MKHRRALIVAIPLVLFVSLLVAPKLAHAGWLDILPNPIDLVLDLGVSTVAIVNALLGQLLNLAKNLLQGVLTISLKAILGLRVIDVAWNLMRDMANLVFVLMLILISFSTIFNVVNGLKRFHYRTALMPVIIAALMMNFSLAIGKAGVLMFDQVARIFINIMPNLGGDLTKALQPQSLILSPQALVGPLPSADDARKGIVGKLTAAEDKRLKECLNEERPVARGNSGDGGADFLIWAYDNVFGPEPGRKGLGDCNLEIIAARQGAWKVAAGQIATPAQEAAITKLNASTPSGTQEQKVYLIFSGVLTGMLLIVLVFCILAPCGFLLLRVIMLWVLLFSSPLAWASYAVPGTDFFKKWWSLFIGWNAFGPVYLFVLIPGMIILSRSGEMLTALGNSTASGTIFSFGLAGGLLQIFMFNAFAVLIFLGGLGVAMKSSFASAVKGTAVLGNLAEQTGAFDATASFRRAGRFTGATAYGQANLELTKQRMNERLQRGTLGKVYQAVKPTSYEEQLAKQKSRLGVTGGTAELNALKAGQVKTQSDDFDKQMVGMNSVRKEAFLRERMNSPDKAVALAAREQLLKMGKLKQPEINDTRKMYPNGPARQEFLKRAKGAEERAVKEAKKAEEEAKKERKENITAAVKAKAPTSIQEIGALMAKYTDPEDQRTVEEQIAKKDPMLLADYKMKPVAQGGQGKSQDVAVAEAYDYVIRNPEDMFKLKPAQQPYLKQALNQMYPPGTPGPVPDAAQKRRDNFKEKLLEKGGSRNSLLVNNIMP